MLDDIISTGGSIRVAAETLKKSGAKEVVVCATHGVLSGNTKEVLSSDCIDQILLTNSIPIPKEKMLKKMKIISLGPLLAKIIKRISRERSLGELFTWEDKVRGL
ncbi:MAG: hypothetical protein ABID04_02610 [Patescibacteria group bacterium]